MDKSRSGVHYKADTQVRRDSLLHPRSRRLHYRGGTEHRPEVRLTLGPEEMRISTLAEVRFVSLLEGVSGEHFGADRYVRLRWSDPSQDLMDLLAHVGNRLMS